MHGVCCETSGVSFRYGSNMLSHASSGWVCKTAPVALASMLIVSVQARREVQAQAATFIELRKIVEDSERKEKAFCTVEETLKVSQNE